MGDKLTVITINWANLDSFSQKLPYVRLENC